MPAFKNDNNGDVVTATGVNAKRLDDLDNWHRVKAGESEAAVKPKRAKRAVKAAAAKPTKAEAVEPAKSGAPTS